jgi:arsenate reductase (thioredoxin)
MRHVLFVCTHNAGRSQMAQAFFERDAPNDVRAESAGTDPRREIWPVVVQAMREVGIDLAGQRPRRLDIEMQLHADWAVTMGCGDSCPYVPTRVESWEIPDPAGRPIEEVREIRDQIERNVEHLIATRLPEIYTDRTAHSLRLIRLLPGLVEDFEGLRSAEEIRACADAVLEDFDDAPIRSFALLLARRATSECLRRDVCDRIPDSVA